MFTKAFWIAAAERLIKTFAQTAAAMWGSPPVIEAVTPINIVDVNLELILGVSVSAAVLSLLTSLASIKLSAGNSPSLVPDAEIEAAQS